MSDTELSEGAKALLGITDDDLAGSESDSPPDDKNQDESPQQADDQAETGQTQDDTSDDSEDQPEGESGLTVKALAEKLGIKPAELYKDLQISVGDGEVMSLSTVKDRAQELVRADTLLAEAEENKTAAENEILRMTNELSLVAQRLGRQPTDAEKAEAQALRGNYVKEQNQLAVAAIPEWKDKAAQATELELMGATLVEYGFSPAEIQNTVDHRQVKLIRDYAALRKRLKDAKATQKADKRRQTSKSAKRTVEKPRDLVAEVKAGKMTPQEAAIRAIAGE